MSALALALRVVALALGVVALLTSLATPPQIRQSSRKTTTASEHVTCDVTSGRRDLPSVQVLPTNDVMSQLQRAPPTAPSVGSSQRPAF